MDINPSPYLKIFHLLIKYYQSVYAICCIQPLKADNFKTSAYWKKRKLPILLPIWPITKPLYFQKLKRRKKLGGKKKVSSSAFAKTLTSCTYFHVITMLSLSEPEGLRLTVMSCGCGEKRSFVSHTLLPITTVLPKTRTSTAFISNWNKQLVWKPSCV